MGKVNKVSKAGKDHGPCDNCGNEIVRGDLYMHAWREATKIEMFSRGPERRRTYRLRNGDICVLTKVHAHDCSQEE